MGAGDCPDDTESQLLRQAMELDLGFSESQLSSAIKHLVKAYGSMEEASSWIPRDNFTVLVSCILDNADLECQQSISPGCQEETGSTPILSAQGEKTRLEEQRKGGNPPSLEREEQYSNGFQSRGNAPSKMEFSDDKVEQRNNLSQPEKCRLDRNALRFHYKKILSTNSVKLFNQGSTDSEVNKARISTTQPEQTNSGKFGHFLPKKKSRSLIELDEHVSQKIPKVAPLQRMNLVEKEDPRTSKKRGHELNGIIKAPSASQKKGRIPEPETTKELVWKARTSMPSGCQDLATGHGSSQVARKKGAEVRCCNSSQDKSSMGRPPAHDERSQIGHVAEQSRETKAVVDGSRGAYGKPRVFVNLDRAAELPGTFRRLKSKDTGCPVRKTEICRAGIPSSSNDGKKASCCVLNEEVKQDSVTYDAESSLGKLPAHDDRFQIGLVAEENRVKKAVGDAYHAAYEKPHVLANLDGAEEVPGTSSRLKSKDTGFADREAETCSAEILSSSNGGQKVSRYVLDEGATKEVNQDSVIYDAESTWLGQLEAFLREGNCQRALEILTAQKKGRQVGTGQTERSHLEGKGHELLPDIPGKKRGFVVSYDISRGLEKMPISCVNEYNTRILPDNFLYVTKSVIRQAAHVDISFSRIGDLHCCCSDDCLRSSEACKCTDSTRGEYAYDKNGQLIERLATSFQSGCNTRNGDFITECCDKCRCSMNCGNRIVQRGITKKLQVFMTPTKKGWGVRALEKIPARSFLFEYLGEIATNAEQFERNLEYAKNGVYTYTMCLDADLDMEKRHFKEGLNDNEALVLDATIFGNVSRFVNHRCTDANLFMRPVQIETRDTHYYHAAFFAALDIQEMEELTWDYGIDFEDKTHLVKAFTCCCKSSYCRGKVNPFNRDKARKGKFVKQNFKDA